MATRQAFMRVHWRATLAILVAPRCPRAHYERRLAQMKVGAYKAAHRSFKRAHRRFDGPRAAQAAYEAARSAAKARRHVTAGQWLVTAIAADPAYISEAATDAGFDKIHAEPAFRAFGNLWGPTYKGHRIFKGEQSN